MKWKENHLRNPAAYFKKYENHEIHGGFKYRLNDTEEHAIFLLYFINYGLLNKLCSLLHSHVYNIVDFVKLFHSL
jgi:hypothetical protein